MIVFKTNKLKLFASGVIASLSIGNSSGQINLNDGLLTYWDFENNFDDTAGEFSTDSTVDDDGTGGSAVIFDADGLLGTFGDFEKNALGTENLVTVPDSDDLSPSGMDSLTVSLWFRVDAFDQNWQALIAHGEGDDWRLARRSGEQGVAYAGGNGDVPGPNITPDVNDGAWHHAIGVTEFGVSSRLYIDGELIGTNVSDPADPAELADNGLPLLYIGGNPEANTDDDDNNQFRPWNGGIDDIALWNRALSDSEINSIFTSGQSGIPLSVLLDTDDNDNDGLPNAYETANGLDPDDPNGDNGAMGDPDGDTIENLIEFQNGTNPQLADTDGDTLDDNVETNTGVFMSNTNTGTDPLNADTDEDGFNDNVETNTQIFISVTNTGTDPFTPEQTADSDGDELFNAWEIDNNLNPFDDGTINPNFGAAGDPDFDSSSNLAEQANGTDPMNPDTDEDGLDDGSEAIAGSNPLMPDSDGDTLLDGEEVNVLGTNPTLADTDGDGFNDNIENDLGSNPLDPSDSPEVSSLPIFDDFEDDVIDSSTWNTITGIISQNATGSAVGGTVEETGGCVQFGSRGYLNTLGQFDPEATGGLQITGQMSFQSGVDVFSIITRGTPTPIAFFGEATSGVQFEIDSNRDRLRILSRNDDHAIADQVVDFPRGFAVDVNYDFTVIDDGAGNLSLTVTQSDDPANTATVNATITGDTSTTDHVIFYNREGGRNSSLHQVAIQPLPGDDIVIQDFSFAPAAGADGEFTITWNSQDSVTYSILGSTDLETFDIEVLLDINGEAGTTTRTFANPSPGEDRLFFRIEVPLPE